MKAEGKLEARDCFLCKAESKWRSQRRWSTMKKINHQLGHMPSSNHIYICHDMRMSWYISVPTEWLNKEVLNNLNSHELSWIYNIAVIQLGYDKSNPFRDNDKCRENSADLYKCKMLRKNDAIEPLPKWFYVTLLLLLWLSSSFNIASRLTQLVLKFISLVPSI